MVAIDSQLSTTELLKLMADHHHQRAVLTDADKAELIALLKKRGQDELDYGEEIEFDSVRLIRRVTGAVGVYCS